jgi:hypothetical protein
MVGQTSKCAHWLRMAFENLRGRGRLVAPEEPNHRIGTRYPQKVSNVRFALDVGNKNL